MIYFIVTLRYYYNDDGDDDDAEYSNYGVILFVNIYNVCVYI